MLTPVAPLIVASKNTHPKIRPSWMDFAWNFPDERECLASFLVLEAAEVLAGVKPANLVQLRNRCQPCGRNLHQLWQKHGVALLEDSPLEALPLRRKASGDLMLFYSPALLQRYLHHPETTSFLRRQGYPSADLEEALSELKRRFRTQNDMPHEIGVFLGYPLKDVAGFMGCSDKPCTACRQWRIYGDPAPSLRLSDRYADCRRSMAARLGEAKDPVELLHQSAQKTEPRCLRMLCS